MANPTIVLFVQAVLVQTVLSQCIGSAPLFGAGLSPALGYDGYGWGAGCAPLAGVSSTGGSFVVTSSSPVPPIGVTIVSENVYEGALCAGGNLPLLGSVGVEGEFPTAGAGAVSYGCGDGAVAIIAEEGPIETGIVEPLFASYGLGAPYGGFAPLGFGYGLGYGRGLGFGPFGYGFSRGCGAFY